MGKVYKDKKIKGLCIVQARAKPVAISEILFEGD